MTEWSYEPKARDITIPVELDSDFHDWQQIKAQLAWGKKPDGTTLSEGARGVLEMKLDNAARSLMLDFENLINEHKAGPRPR